MKINYTEFGTSIPLNGIENYVLFWEGDMRIERVMRKKLIRKILFRQVVAGIFIVPQAM